MLVSTQFTRSRAAARQLLRVVTVGDIDHGKSTLIGRLLYDTGNLPDSKLEVLTAVSGRRGMRFEWAFLMDALQTERDQGITLETSQIRFRTRSRDVILIDAPGHGEFLRNMVTGAAQADAALLVVDAAEGVREQTRRHAYLLHLLGIRQVAVVINKMDRFDFAERRFHAIAAEIARHLSGFGLTASAIVPVSARNGDGVARRTPAIAWYAGPTVVEIFDRFAPARPLDELPPRMPIQAVYKFDDRRIIAGRIESGRIAVGDEVTVAPRGTTARVRSIEAWPAPDNTRVPRAARAGQSIGLTLDRPVFVARGDLLTVGAPAKAARRLRARIFWLNARPLAPGDTVGVRVGTAQGRGTIAAIANGVDPGRLSPDATNVIASNHVGEIDIALEQPLAADIHAENPRTGRVVLDVSGRIAGGGLILSAEEDSLEVRSGGPTSRSDSLAGHGDPAASHGVEVAAEAARLDGLMGGLPPAQRIARFVRDIAGRTVFTTSFGLEDQVILHLIVEHGLDVEVVTLDTGRLFRETYDLWAATESRYGRRVRAIYPRHENVEAIVEEFGINGFYQSRAARLACCYARKVEPLGRALAGAVGWIVGLRADQSANRRGTGLVAVDERGLFKLSPLFDWTREMVQSFAAENGVPINSLHAKSFVSVGCAPCTRAIAPGEPERAGRWWWEADDKKECGLHTPRG
ncbi:MAG TPA: phosphoadenylyl-sulfate reductase [Xanthobacteraceae bacterium]|jgi:phosphoadenylyl-sulfate reductase (thioredoxin)|nr:phosphoadenylyl-sulfate reductase [Xanthobacteraceae bacterium]